jgi:hypothetical protein
VAEEAEGPAGADGGLTVGYTAPIEVATEQFIRDIVARCYAEEDLYALHVDATYSVNCWA